MVVGDTGCSLNIVFFPYSFVIFLYSASSVAALVFYLPGLCTHTDTEGKQSPEYFNILRKHTIFNEHPVQLTYLEFDAERICPSSYRLNIVTRLSLEEGCHLDNISFLKVVMSLCP